ncbi:MAG TPA: histone deacetylase [Acidimicrobiaceae bacterium]|nr:histone deacetylase [Acidimicrobiaceae bacterium]
MNFDRIWYGAYGSNVLQERFLRYIEGGRYASNHPHQVGARDNQRPGAKSPLLHGPWSLSFGYSSERWGGGVAFLDPEIDEAACIRCWNITDQQFMDVAAQENGLQPGEIEVDIAEVKEAGELVIGDTWYSRIVYLGEYLGQPIMTFTSSESIKATAPGKSYLSVILNGFLEAAPTQIDLHLDRLLRAHGVDFAWTRETLLELANLEN